MTEALEGIIQRYKDDNESVYNTWFVNNEDRLKAFRSIRRGVQQVIKDIKEKKMGADFKGSSLEFILSCITEQKQVFEGAAHPFYWKPKLRIPDIYENESNKIAFGQFLENCLNASRQEQLVKEILTLDQLKIKGLGPAVANILYFLHPTLMPPFNTAIVNGFNLLFQDKKKLGSWLEYLTMREVIIKTNTDFKHKLSVDLGACSGLLFDVGMRKILVGDDQYLTDDEKERIGRLLKKRRQEVANEHQEEDLHTEMQYYLLKIGSALGYDVISAVNDRSKSHNGNSFSFISLPSFPMLGLDKETNTTISLVDVIWFKKNTNEIVSAFEVEKSTSIYSGILRLSDLAFSFKDKEQALFLIVPDLREKEVIMQLKRPAIKGNNLTIKYIMFSELRQNCDALCKFGDSHLIMTKIAKEV
jgi:type II restriction enzyme